MLIIDDWDEETQMAACRFKANRRFTDWLKVGLKPASYRRWDGKVWRVHMSQLPLTVSMGRRYFHHVDYSALPAWVQMLIAEGTKNATRVPPMRLGATPYDTLHLLPSAPWEVVKAAYKALAIIHHPDHDGDAEVFREVTDAYKDLESKLVKS